jgi:hypothetical protein
MSAGRGLWLLASLALSLSLARAANPLTVVYDGERLRPIAPDLHFLTGRSLERVKDGDQVLFVAKLSIFTIDQSVPFREQIGKFMVSYDIWEEKFGVVITESASRSRTGMTAPQAEAWCLEGLGISAARLSPDRPFFMRLELRTADPKEFSSVMADPVRAFMELLSRKAGPGDPHWGPFQSGAMRLSDLVRTAGRGAPNG